jgi:dynein heavy chain
MRNLKTKDHRIEVIEVTINVEETLFICIMCAIGRLFNAQGRIKFSEFLFKEFKTILSEDIECTKFFDYVCDSESGGTWAHWNSRLNPYIYPKDEVPEFYRIFIPTAGNLRIDYLMNLLSNGGRLCLLLGYSETAKTTTINIFISKFEKI